MRFIVFGGTTEGRNISDYLSDNKIMHTLCVATLSGEAVMEKNEYVDIRVGRMDCDQIKEFLRAFGDEKLIVIDATHPYATAVSDNIQKACKGLEIECTRVSRVKSEDIDDGRAGKDLENIYYYANADECAKSLAKLEGNILLTTGSKELKAFSEVESVRERIFVRVLPSVDSLRQCQAAGISEKRIIAMYGPHTEETNRAIINQFGIKHLVTKESGSTGGYEEKVKAAVKTGCSVHVIKRPNDTNGVSVEECIETIDKWIENQNDIEIISDVVNTNVEYSIKATLAGVGMGNEDTLTIAAKIAIDNADVILGASRMTEPYKDNCQIKNIYMAKDIIPYLEEIKSGREIINSNRYSNSINVVILFSGDTGIYSGASKLYKALEEWGGCSEINMLPGISSFSAFAARLGNQYTGAYLESLHGKSDDIDNIDRIKSLVMSGEEVYVLMSGKSDFKILEDIVCGNNQIKIEVGYNISYDSEQIIHSDAHNLADMVQRLPEGLYIAHLCQE